MSSLRLPASAVKRAFSVKQRILELQTKLRGAVTELRFWGKVRAISVWRPAGRESPKIIANNEKSRGV